ncbi:MAG: Coagulation factor 5/8 type domain protein [Verrucomicrobiales bacterium]|nr:Coagulation factor 5/8 type domain protein [Verrucomicrobiales bacterium]
MRLSSFKITVPVLLYSLLALNPSQIRAQQPAPVLLLQADHLVTADTDGFTTLWADGTTNHNDALQPDPNLAPKLVTNVVNGKPVLRFDGVNDYLDVAPSDTLDLTADVSTFFVVRFTDFATYRAVWSKTSVNQPAPLDYYLLPGSGTVSLWRGDGNGPNDKNLQSTRAVKANTWVVLGYVITNGTATLYLNGQPIGSSDMTTITGDSGLPLRIGSREDFVTRFKGDMAELVIYNVALTGDDLINEVNSLKTKYGILNDPPTVSLTAPAAGSMQSPTNFTLTATAADTDGKVVKVDFLANGSLLATAVAPPYSLPVSVSSAGSIIFTARATDDKDGSTISAPITVTFTGTGAPSYTAPSSLKLWLKADAGVTAGADGSVTQWKDQSGNTNDAVMGDLGDTTTPVLVPSAINGKPALRFDGVDDYLSVTSSDSIAIAGDITSFFVVRFDDAANYRAVWAKTTGNAPATTDYYILPGSAIPRFYRGTDLQQLGSVDGAGAVPLNSPTLLGFGQQGTHVTHFLDGRLFGSGEITAALADGGTPLLIGTRGDQFTRMKGDIAEILIFDASLDDAGRSDLVKYLGAKYTIATLQPKNTAPIVNLTAPAEGLQVTVPATVSITANASDADGAVSRVEFYANGALISPSTNAPYSATLSPTTTADITLTAVAFDNFGISTTSAPVHIKASATAPLPIPADGLELWLRADKGVTADGGVISKWDDSSGNFNTAIANSELGTAPTLVPSVLNGQPVVRFNGVKDELVVNSSPSIAITGDISTFFVVRFENFDTFRAVWAKTAGNQPRPSDYYTLPSSGVPNVFRGGAGGIANFQGDGPVPANTPAIVGWDMVGTTITHYVDNQPNGSGDITVTPTDAGDPLLIGTRGDQFTRMMGDIAEIVIYNRGLTETERNQIHDYLRKKYGLGGNEGPSLTVAAGVNNTVVISWPTAAVGFILESSAQADTGYTTATEAVIPSGNQNTVTVSITGAARFFRLKNPAP